MAGVYEPNTNAGTPTRQRKRNEVTSGRLRLLSGCTGYRKLPTNEVLMMPREAKEALSRFHRATPRLAAAVLLVIGLLAPGFSSELPGGPDEQPDMAITPATRTEVIEGV